MNYEWYGTVQYACSQKEVQRRFEAGVKRFLSFLTDKTISNAILLRQMRGGAPSWMCMWMEGMRGIVFVDRDADGFAQRKCNHLLRMESKPPIGTYCPPRQAVRVDKQLWQ